MCYVFPSYQSEYFVGRKKELDETQKHLADARSANYQKIIAITGPPKMGKSWFLRHLFDDVQLDTGNPCTAESNICIGGDSCYINLHSLIDSSNGTLKSNDLRKLILECGAMFNPHFFPSIDPNHADLTVLFRFLFESIIARESHHSSEVSHFFLFIDSLDELNDSAWKSFERNIISQLVGYLSITLVIATREEYKLTHPQLSRKRTDIPLLPFSQDDAVRQIQSLPARPENIELFMRKWHRYDWSHPGVNEFLRALEMGKILDNNNNVFRVEQFTDKGERHTLLRLLITDLRSVLIENEQQYGLAATWLERIIDELEELWDLNQLTTVLQLNPLQRSGCMSLLRNHHLILNDNEIPQRNRVHKAIYQVAKHFNLQGVTL